ncbi:hypothetical protein CsatB_024601 [Cannabis sativa]
MAFSLSNSLGKVSITFQENALFQRDCKGALTLFANHLNRKFGIQGIDYFLHGPKSISTNYINSCASYYLFMKSEIYFV